MVNGRRPRQIGLMSRIRELRERADMTQGELAEKAEVSQTYLSRIERGGRPGSVQALRRIAAALNVGISELFEKDGRDQLFMALLDELDPDDQEEALVMLEVFVRAVRKRRK